MLVSGKVVPFFMVRRSHAVSLRGKIVVFSSFLVRIVHISTSVATPFCPRKTSTHNNDTSINSTALSKFETVSLQNLPAIPEPHRGIAVDWCSACSLLGGAKT